MGAPPRDAPGTDGDRDDYCAFVRAALASYPQVRDVVIWNEPNKQYFWLPQYSESDASVAPAAYVALLARCWDVLHAFRADVNLITSTSSRGGDNPDASSNVSHSPQRFVVAMGQAYRASRRTRPIFDTVGHHPYGDTARERPWRRHPLSSTIGLGDWDKLVQAYHDAFADTSQPNPGRCVAGRCAPIWYMENGYQTTVAPAVAGLYSGSENVTVVPADGPGDPAGSVPDERSVAPDHATQLTDAIRLATCQPYVGAYFNFMLADERNLAGWQSGLLWADWSPKPAFAAFAAAAAEVRAGRVDCAALKGFPAGSPTAATGAPQANALFPGPRTDVPVLRTLWPRARRFNWRNDLWRFRIAAGEDAVYAARLVELGRGGRELAARTARPRLRARGSLKRAYLTWVVFERRRLAPGRHYRMEITLTSVASRARTVLVAGPAFYVARPARGRTGR
ncbi:MAG: hypothetical protein ICV64_07495 [Thermoleophilia bacterium]|nr:hypothetical protein [Thermoleophilia bacterium]